ncbi:hypothetical protein BVI1335_1400010 [Burkholderia vietnamiensis]|nr:hypothetical protein BVI1335_1400010 [Burkholderia vietnamiensis]
MEAGVVIAGRRREGFVKVLKAYRVCVKKKRADCRDGRRVRRGRDRWRARQGSRSRPTLCDGSAVVQTSATSCR